MNLGYLLLLFLLLLIQSCLSVPRSRFYEFAGSTGDQTFTGFDDQSTSLNLLSNFVFYGTNFSSVFINNNGLLSFYMAVRGYTSQPFPLNETLIAPFWADVDTTNGAGVVYFRETTDSAIVTKVAQDIALAFRNQPPFTAKSVVIVTWDEVGYYQERNDKLNTFQCVLATDGGRSYVLFLYLDDGINWVTGDLSGGTNGFGGTEAYVGFNSGGSNPTFFAVEGSRTPAVIDIETTSNVEVAGLWIFQVNEAEIITSTVGSCVTPDQLYANAAILSYNTTTVNSTATYSCQNGYNLVGVSVRTCQSSGNWSGSPPYCQIVNCTELMVESSERLSVSYSSNSFSYNSTVTYSCQNGYNLVGATTRTCQSSGSWSGNAPYCQIVNCTDLMVESSGALSVSYSSNSFSYNSTVTYSCQNGYNLVGATTRTCQSSGSWSGNAPYCQIVNCTDLMVESSGALSVSYSSNSFSYNSTVTYSCQNGYNLVGAATRTCQSSGSWSGNAPYCQIVNCTDLMVESSGALSVSYSSNSFSYNSTVTYSCQNGYNLVGTATRTCQSDGSWDGNEPYCQIVNCTELMVESNAVGGLSISYSSNSRSYNSTVTYSCQNGYNLAGVSVRTCLSNGNWSGDPPYCQSINCSELYVESNTYGGLSVTSSSSSLNGTATYSCTYEGYILVGNGVRTCQANGNWSGVEPNCEITAINPYGTSNESSIIISWDVPCQPRDITTDRMINNYTIMVTDTATGEYFKITTTMIPVVLSNLTLNTNYSIRIAVFTSQLGPFSDPIYISTQLKVPTSPPFDLIINSSSPSSFMISWTPPMLDYLNGPNVTYVIQVESANSSSNYTSETNYAHIVGLQPFTTYWSRVAVRNNAGMGPYSITIEIKTPGDAPSSAPADIIFNFTDPRTLFIQWGLIPFSNRNGMIMYYEVLVTTEEKTYTYKTCDRNITIDSLQPSNTYNVSVAAFTNGRGPFSDPISITMPDDIPSGRPQSPSVAATATSLNISWSAPNEEDRNGDINGYVINVTNTDTLVTMQFTTANNEFSVNDLDPDTTYSLSVAARNANGTGPFTLPILIRTDQSAPSQPRRLRATAISPSSILLAWEPPANPNGDITAYHISITDEETGNVVIQETSNLTYVIITDLTPNNTYRCHVAAATTSMGPDSEYIFFNTEEDTPSASPSSVMSTVINSTAITVSWPPLNQSSTNGVIRHYKVSITNAVTGSEEILTTTTPNLTITMLTPFTQYSVRVAAFTIGSGPYSNPINVTTAEDVPTDAPESFNVTNNGPTSLILKWSPPKNLNGMIRSYKITIRDETNGTVICFNTTELEVTVDNLNPFTMYTCNVTAYTVAPGPAASVTIRTPESVPAGPPTGVMIKSVSYTSINISWNTPEMSNGVIRSYVIRVSNGSVVKEYNATGMDTFIVIRGLGSNQNYTISLAAVTNERGPFSNNLSITLEEKVATDPPTGLMNELNGTNLTLNWQPPPDGSVDGNISGYRINCTGENGHVISKTVSMTSSSVQLESGTYYKCTVCTLTSAGCGPAAVNYINTYSGSSVGAPHSVIVNATDLTILIKWEPPLDPLNIITSYVVTYQLLDTPLPLTVPRPIATVSGITDTMYLLDSVIAGSSYDITVYANTSRGAGLQSTPITVTTKESDSLLNFTCITDSATDIDCSWKDLPDDDVYHLHYSILPSFSYYGDSEGNIDIDILNEGHFHDLQPYAGYILSIQTTANVSIASAVAFTSPEIPSVSVNGVSFDKDSLILSWDLPPKAGWRGIIENFIIKAVPLQSIGEGPISKRSTGNNATPQEVEITVAPSMNNPDPSLATEPFQRESVNMSNLEQDYEYSLTIAIDNEAGSGPFSAPMNITVPEAAPSGPPINLMLANVNQTSFTVTWDPPNLLERNGRIVGYMVQVTRVNLLETRSFETNDTSISLQGYYPYERIMVKVAAETSVGLGPYSSILDFNTSQNVPSAPLSFNGDIIGRDGIDLRWKMPRTTPGVISEYQVTYSGYTIASNIQVVGPIQTSLSEKHLRLISLRTGLVYHFSVRAKTAAGFGPNATTVVVLEDISSTISSVSGGVQEEGTIAASVLAGLFGLLLCLFLFLLLLCCLCMMTKRRRRKRENDSNEYQSTNNKMYINEYDPDNEMKEVSFADVKRSPQNGDEKKPSGSSKHIYDVPSSSSKRATTVSVNTSRPADYEYDTVTSPEETSIKFEGNDGSSMMEVKLYFTDESSDEEEIKKK